MSLPLKANRRYEFADPKPLDIEEDAFGYTVTFQTGRQNKLIVPAAIPYYQVRTDNQHLFPWAIDPTDSDKTPVSKRSRVDLKEGDTDATMPFSWISDLELDLYDFGFRAVVANQTDDWGTIADDPEPTGTLRTRVAWNVRRFQVHALTPSRMSASGGPMSVEVTFGGSVTGIVDDETKREIEIWKTKGYRRLARPFDPEGFFPRQVALGQVCPDFNDLIQSRFIPMCDEEDIELYGPSAATVDPDLFRQTHSYSTWHLYGLGCDLNFYKHDVAGEHIGGSVAQWMMPDLRRMWDIAHRCGMATDGSNDAKHIAGQMNGSVADWRHVEYHPLLNGRNRSKSAQDWVTPWPSNDLGDTLGLPRRVRKRLLSAKSSPFPDTGALNYVWAAAVDPRFDLTGGWPDPATDELLA